MAAESPCGGPRRFWGAVGRCGMRARGSALVGGEPLPAASLAGPTRDLVVPRVRLRAVWAGGPRLYFFVGGMLRRLWLSVVAVVVGPHGVGWSPGGWVRGRIWSQNRPAGDRGASGGPRAAGWVRPEQPGTVGEPAPPPTASHRTHPHIDPDLPAQLRCFPVLDLSGSQPAPASGPDPPSFEGGAACSSGLQFRRSSGCHPPGQDPRSRFQSWHTGPWRWCVRRGSAKSTKNRNGSRT